MRMIYCDLDGVLADFNGTFKQLTGFYPDEVSRETLWKKIEQIPDYWSILTPFNESNQLIQYLRPHSFQILTGLPTQGYQKAEKEKIEWVYNHIGKEINVICCLSKDKPLFCKRNDILIDDHLPNINGWIQAGGIGIHHKSVSETITQLKKYGF